MRVLLTRPARGAERTAEALRQRGHAPICLPLTVAEPLSPSLPEQQPAALLATSAEALIALSGHAERATLSNLPIYCVGAATAAAARAAGLAPAQEGPGDAPGLVAEIIEAHRARPFAGPILYLAGTPRMPAVEAGLSAAGIPLLVVELYRMVPVVHEDLAGTIAASGAQAVLFFSREAVRLFFEALVDPAQSPGNILCLSHQIAAAVPAGAGAVHVAARPDEAALLTLLDALAAR